MRSEQVKAFIIAAEKGSFSKAGVELKVGRSTVSAKISALEDSLGVTLFRRSGNSVTITSVGKALLADAQRLVQAAEHMHLLAKQHIDGVESELKIVRDDALPETFWHHCMQQLQLKFPSTSVAAYLVPCKEHQLFLKENIVDIAFGVNSQAPPANQVASISQHIVVHPEHPLAQLGLVTRQDLQQYRQICLAHLQEHQLATEQRIGQHYLGLTMFEVIRDSVLRNDGWALLPSTLVQQEIQSQKLVILTSDAIPSVTYLQCLNAPKLGKAGVWLKNYVRESFFSVHRGFNALL